MACDKCHEWMHTRCNGISDSQGVPASFMCAKCLVRVEEEGRQAAKEAEAKGLAETEANGIQVRRNPIT